MIEISNLSKVYENTNSPTVVIQDFSLSIGKGEFVAIIGDSGIGKSTLMNIIGCLDFATNGKYFLCGSDVTSLSGHKLAKIRNQKIGFIFQSYNLISSLTALQNVELPLVYRKIPKVERRELAISAIVRVGLEGRMNYYPSQLSGGQQQRIAIARAIAASPDLILADEPTGNLDRNSAKDVMEIMSDLHKFGKTIVLITHDEYVASYAERILDLSVRS